MGFIDLLSGIFGSKSQRDVKAIAPIVQKIKALETELQSIDNDALRRRVAEARRRIGDSVAEMRSHIAEVKAKVEETPYEEREPLWKDIDDTEKKILDRLEEKLEEELPEVFAVVKETARRFKDNEVIEVTATDFDRQLAGEGRDFLSIDGDKALWYNHWIAGGNEVTWDMVHYDVQLIGGVVLHRGKIAEMATGEGKTLVATLPVFLNALTGNGVHVVTVNDYLAKRDSEWMGPIYMFHGISVGCIDKTQPNSDERREAYNCDITFGTNNEFGFDYLRDNMATSPKDLVQRAHNYAIVDEVDSVLIDDARTPLIISGPVPQNEDQMFTTYKPNVVRVVDAQRRLVTQLLADARTKLASEDKEVVREGALLLFRAYKGLPKYGPLIKFLSQEGMKKVLLETEAHYLQDNQREMPVVTDPLYFVIDEKNNSIEMTDKGHEVLAGTTDDPDFFVLPDIAGQLSEIEGNTADAIERQRLKDEAMQAYAVKSERVHTVNQLLKAYTLFSKDVEYVIDDGEVKIVDEQTGRIMEGRRYSEGLHQAIEAKENVKVQGATQTFATITLQNYFRMYHKLAGMTGTAETEAGEFWDIYKLDVVTIPTNRPVAREDNPDRVYKTKKGKYKAVIAEIERMIEAGRPVLVGTTSVEISELLSRMLDIRHIPHQVLNAKLHQKEADIVAQAGRKGTVTIATNMAGRGTDIKLTPEVREAGGLAIIGTERHESRRVDRQLRGRSGRQGDPGSSVFYVSFEDDVMRKFASDRVVKMLDTLGYGEDDMIESKMVTNAIEKAQKRVEENNFGIRKHLLEYDDVMNAQRKVIYGRRHHALMGERIGIDIMNMFRNEAEMLIDGYDRSDDFPILANEVMKIFAVELPFSEEEFNRLSKDELTDKLYQGVIEAFNRKMDRIAETANPIIKQIVEEQDGKGLIRVPITDGKRTFGIVCDITEAYDSECRSISKAWQKAVLLLTIDEAWKEHLLEMDQLRRSAQNAAYEQKDPLLIYKHESFAMFQNMVAEMNEKSIGILMRGQIPMASPEEQQRQVQRNATEQRSDRSRYRENKDDYAAHQEAQRRAGQGVSAAASPQQQPVVNGPKVGRNDPCPCGSGKKFKNCHGRGL